MGPGCKTNMNLLMLGWELPPHNSGGLGVACLHMARALARHGVSIDFMLPYSAAAHPEIDWMTIHGVKKNIPETRSMTELAYTAGYDEIRLIQKDYIDYIEYLVQNKHFDAVHAHDWLTMQAGMRAKEIADLPLIVHVHATEFDRSGSNNGNPLIHEIEYQGLMAADRILAVSQITKDIIVQRYGIPASKVEVVYNALDIDSFEDFVYDRRTYKYLEQLKTEGYTVVSNVTRMTIQKGLTFLVRAFARASERYDKLVLLLVGDGEQRDELIQLAADLGVSDKVFFSGFVRGYQWRSAYSVTDIFVMSSVSEPFGLSALEAAHHHSALIVSKQSGVGEVLHNIYRYDFWDTDRLADQIVGIATCHTLKGVLVDGVRSEYAKISWADVAQQCVAIYNGARKRIA